MSLLVKLPQSKLGLKGETPGTIVQASKPPHLGHPSGERQKVKYSALDLDGKTPGKYMDNPPR